MKKSIILSLFIALAGLSSAFSQSKVGFVEYEYLISLMPELKTVEKKLLAKKSEFEGSIKEIENKLVKLNTELQNPELDPIIIQQKRAEGQRLQGEYQEFTYRAQQRLEEVQMSEMEAVYAKLNEGIAVVAKEKNYDYVLTETNAGGFNIIFAKNEQDNLTKAVMTKLNLSELAVTGQSGQATNSLLVQPK